jgi:uncharacterized protein
MPRSRRPPAPTGGDPGRVFVDSGAWIALFSAADQHHAAADAGLRLAAARRIRLVTTSLVVAEVHRLLLFRAGIRAAVAALDALDHSALLDLHFTTRDDHRAARAWLARLPDQPISYTDAMSFAVMRALRCSTALTFDHHFDLAGFTRWQPAPAR